MLRNKFSRRNEKMEGYLLDGERVKRQVGMIYWYSYGEHEFDIRVVRHCLGLPKETEDDKFFMAQVPDRIGSFNRNIKQIEDALNGRRFMDVIEEQDRMIRKSKGNPY